MAVVSDMTLTELRRDLHAHAEAGWKEFRTTALVAESLEELGYDMFIGAEALVVDERLGVPPDEAIAAAVDRAVREGAPERYVDRMDGVTGLVAQKRYGDGPVVGVRVDMDALERQEADDDDHRPAREGFASKHPGEMHACGHDGHTAIGVGIARALEADGFEGTIKLFFQPAEEGGRGGKAMSRSAHLDDVEYIFGLHLGLDHPTGRIIAAYERPLSNAKLDVTFLGESAHAGKAPNEGRNALQALATAIQNLYAIPRHGDGLTRVNVGMVESLNAQNVISEQASMLVDVRGREPAQKEYMKERAERVVRAAAEMHAVEAVIEPYGETTTFVADNTLVEVVASAAAGVGGVEEVVEREDFRASEDASFLIRRVQEHGGKATYVGIGASNPAGHHTPRFDIDEDALEIGVDVLTTAIRSL